MDASDATDTTKASMMYLMGVSAWWKGYLEIAGLLGVGDGRDEHVPHSLKNARRRYVSQ